MKNLFRSFLTALCFFTAASIFGQTPQTSPTPPEDEKDIIRVSSQEVLIDALVLDKDGRQVTNLNADDFEIFQDGKLQKTNSFTYVNLSKPETQTLPTTESKKKNEKINTPPISVRSGQGRVITFVVDDGNCLATLEGLEIARDAMKKFINEQMLSNDKVAIYRTRGGSSLLQLYTSNKEVLKRIVGKVNWFPSSCGSAFDSSRNDSVYKPARPSDGLSAPRSSQGTFENEADKESRNANENDEREKNAFGTTGVLNFVIERLKNLPQRKIVFFLSEGIPIDRSGRARDALREVADRATRSSVVIYPMSEKGMTIPGMIEARDEVNTEELKEARNQEERSLNDGLSYLAYATGGEFIRNKSFLDTEIKEILSRETGYYLIGYQPEGETFNGKDFHKIEIRLKRPELRVVARKEFFGKADTETKTKNRTAETPLYQAITSPLQANGINLRLTSLFENKPKEGNSIHALFHIEGKDLTFTDESNGIKKIVLDVVAVALDEKGKVVEEFNRTYPIRIPPQGVQTVAQNGLDFSATIPIKKPGFYGFRLAVRDNNSKNLGSAGDFIEIPDLAKGKFLMEGLIATTVTSDGKPLLPKDRPVNAAFAPVFTYSIPSIRQYQPNDVLAYAYTVYNAKLDSTTKQPKLTTQIRLYKDGKVIVEGKENAAQIEPQADMLRIADYGLFQISKNAEAGDYILQVTVKDTLSGKTASQWIDFEIVK